MRKIGLIILCVLTVLFMGVGCSLSNKPEQEPSNPSPNSSYTVIYQAGEGSGRAHTVSVENGEHVLIDYETIDFVAPEGKEFDFWQVSNLQNEQKQVGDKISVSEDITVVAIWKVIPREVTVTYQPGEGGGNISAIDIFAGEYTLLDLEDLGFTAPNNKEFVCWQIGVPKVAEKQPGDVITISDDTVIIAIWTQKTDAKMELAIGKTVDLGSIYTDKTLGKDVEWTVVSGSACVDLALGGDNLQAVAEGVAILEATAGQETYSVKITCEYATEVEDIVDFVIEVEDGRDIKVLQITDTQLVDSAQASISGLNDLYKPENFENNCFKYIREAVRRTQPDLIIMTGDNVWGSFDDNGTALTALINVLDSFDIPWAGVYGNHDNETEKGAQWQNEQYQFSENGLFLRGVTDGNGNYTIGIKQGGEVKRVFFMMDTNLCSGAYNPTQNYVTTSMGFTNDQVDWFKRTSSAMLYADENVKLSMAYHVPNYAFTQAMQQYDSQLTDTYYYTLGLDVVAKDGDFGTNNQMSSNNAGGVIDYENGQVKTYGGKTLVEIYQDANVDSVFVGHQHDISLSMVYEGIRWTYGLKTGIYDLVDRDNIGATVITINDNNALSVKHVYYNENYQAYRENLPENFTIAGAVVMDKNSTISPSVSQRTAVAKEYIGGYGAYKLSTSIQGEFNIDPSLIAGKKSVTFSFYVPSTSTARLGWPVSAFSVMQTSDTTSNYQPYSANGVETSSNERNVCYDYDEWTTVTVDLKVNGVYCFNRFSWIIAAGNVIYIKDISFTDLDPKSEATVNVTVNKDGVEDTDETIKNKVLAYLNEMYYVEGDIVDISAFVKKLSVSGYKIDVKNSVLTAEVPVSGSIDFTIAYKTYVEIPVEGRGNLATTLKSSGLATSTYNTEGKGQLFHYGDNNVLYFNAWQNCGNYIILDSNYVKESFDAGYTSIKISYYVTSFGGGWIKIGPKKYDGTNQTSAYLSARDKEPWLSNEYDSVDSLYESFWNISASEVAGFNFAAGDQLWIGEMASGSGKTQIAITHFEFIKPIAKPGIDDYNGLNLLTLDDVFDADTGVMGRGTVCESGTCWNQFLDISADSAEAWGYEGKYLNLYWHCWSTGPYLYFKQDFLNKMLAEGNTILTVVLAKSSSAITMRLHDYNIAENITGSSLSGEGVTEGNLTTYTCDVSKLTIKNNLAICMAGSIGAKLYVLDINFSAPEEKEEVKEEIDYDGLNLLTLENLFNTETGIMAENEDCDAGHQGCWVQFLDISASDESEWGYSGKYINMKRQGWCDIAMYLKGDFAKDMIEQGLTTLTIVFARQDSNIDLGVYDCAIGNDGLISEWSRYTDYTKETTDKGLVKYTFDLSSITLNNQLAFGLRSAVDKAVWITEITFSNPAV